MINIVNRVIFFSIIFFIYFLAWKIQNNVLLNGDVSWLSYAAKKWLNGGNYGTDFFETNPPLILYLYTPLLLIEYLFKIDIAISLRIYIFFITTISISYCYILMETIIEKENNLLKTIIIFTLLGLFLISPVSEFGQREHLTILLCTPYFFLIATRLKNKCTPSLFIGIMAGIGFALKPYFYLPFVLVEIFYIFYKQKIFAFHRIEFYCIILIGSIYLVIILLFHHNYLSIIIPLIVSSYYPKYQQSFNSILLNDQTIYGYFLIIFYAFFYKRFSYPSLMQVLWIAFFGFWIIFAIQQMGWLYHALPFYNYEILIYTLLYLDLITKNNLTKKDYFKMAFFNIIIILYYVMHMPYISLSLYYYPYMIFLLFSGICAILLYNVHAGENLKYFFVSVSIILLLNTLFYSYIKLTSLNNYSIFLSPLMWLLCFILFIKKDKIYHAFFALSGIFIFIFPFYKTAYIEDYSHYYKNLYQHLITDTQIFSNQKVYFFTAASELAFPLIDYANLNYSSRFWSMVWLPLLKEPEKTSDYTSFYKEHQKKLDFYISCIIEDFIKKHPTYIFVDIRTRGYFFNIPINYIDLFSKNFAFKKQWQQYHLVKIIDYPPLYKFAIYTI